jgi:hypothetical protein
LAFPLDEADRVVSSASRETLQPAIGSLCTPAICKASSSSSSIPAFVPAAAAARLNQVKIFVFFCLEIDFVSASRMTAQERSY